MASQSKDSTRWGATLSAGALVAIFGASLVAGPSGCFLNSNGAGLGTGGTGGNGGASSSSTASVGGGGTTSSSGVSVSSSSGTSVSSSVSSSSSSSSGTVCTVPMDCGAHPPCHPWACEGGVCKATTTMEGEACSGQTGFCDAAGACHECFPDGSVTVGCKPKETCSGGTCVSCTDTKLNGDESDVDCGGGTCPKCKLGDDCNADTDCMTTNCASGKCSTCTDNVKNNGETDVDCGGNCKGCNVGQVCAVNTDCANGNCAAGFCKAKNGDACVWYMDCSSGLCSQSMCKPCTTTGDCGVNSACNAGVCSLPPGGLCATATDCFGGSCLSMNPGFCTKNLPVGDPCIDQGDCSTHTCTAGVCASCTGSACKGPTGAPCSANNQCASMQCVLKGASTFKNCM